MSDYTKDNNIDSLNEAEKEDIEYSREHPEDNDPDYNYVLYIRAKDGSDEERVDCRTSNLSVAERVQRGARINLSPMWYTELVREKLPKAELRDTLLDINTQIKCEGKTDKSLIDKCLDIMEKMEKS